MIVQKRIRRGACLAIVLAGMLGTAAAPGIAKADWFPNSHNDVVQTTTTTTAVVPAPGLVTSLGDDEFARHWSHSTYDERAHFCRVSRHDCEMDGKHSRACYLKWKYCTPQSKDYGYYYNR